MLHHQMLRAGISPKTGIHYHRLEMAYLYKNEGASAPIGRCLICNSRALYSNHTTSGASPAQVLLKSTLYPLFHPPQDP